MELNPSSIYPTADAEEEGEIVVNEVNGTWFLKSGKKALTLAMKQGRKFVPVKVDASFKPQLMTKEAYQEFERDNQISYKKYPDESVFAEKNFMNFSRM